MSNKQGSPNHPYTTVDDSTTGLPLPATHNDTSDRRRCSNRRCLLSIVCCFFVTLAATIGTSILVEFLVVQPKNGAYALQEAFLKTFNLTTNGTTSYSLDTDLALEFLFSNPNHKMGFDIKGVSVTASYAGVVIGQSSAADVPPFYQGRRNETVISTEVRNVTTRVLSAGDESLPGNNLSNVTLFVAMNARVRNNHGFLVSMHPFRKIHLNCLVNLMTPNGSTPGTLISKSCSIKRDGMH